MLAVNGATPLTAPEHPHVATGKRKRSPSVAAEERTNGMSNGEGPEHHTGAPTQSLSPNASSRDIQKALLQVMQRWDTKPSVLDRDNTDVSGAKTRKKSASSSGESTSSHPQQTIQARLANGEYTSLHQLQDEIDKSCEAVRAILKEERSNPSAQTLSMPVAVHNFQQQCHALIARQPEFRKRPLEKDEAGEDGPNKKAKAEDAEDGVVKFEEVEEGPSDSLEKQTLTFFGNAQGVHRQLFSSLQKPMSRQQTREDPLLPNAEVYVPLEEEQLPPGVYFSKTMSTSVLSQDEKPVKSATFAEVFGPAPSSLISQSIPGRSNTRKTNIGWVKPEVLPRNHRRASYVAQILPSGQWLGWSGVSSSQEPGSPSSKRKHRERALSTGEARPAWTAAEAENMLRAKEEALFRAAYSSFAPHRDEASAIIPTQLRNQVWYRKHGERQLGSEVIDPALLDDRHQTATGAEHEEEANDDDDDDDTKLKQAVDDFEPEPTYHLVPNSQKSKADKDTQELLDEISEMLETMHSYQKIRYGKLSWRNQLGAATAAPSADHSHANPSDAEVDMYKMLKDQLILTISMLPPYAVAKLNGDHLADLNLSQKFVLENDNISGQMDEDNWAKLAKASATAIARPMATAAAQHAANTQYGRTSSFPQPNNLRSAQAIQGYYPQQQPPHKTPANQYMRNSQAQAQAAQSRAVYTQYAQYSQSPIRSQAQSYTPNYAHTGSQQRPGYYAAQNYATATPTTSSRGFPPLSQAAYAARPTNGAPPTATPTAASPTQDRGGSTPITPGTYPNQIRWAQYNTPATNMETNNNNPNSALANGTPANHASNTSAIGPSGFHSSMTTEQQQIMMERQRQQAAMQQNARQAATQQAAHMAEPTPTPAAAAAAAPTPAQPASSPIATPAAPAVPAATAPAVPTPTPASAESPRTDL